jgi:hypothetical protein
MEVIVNKVVPTAHLILLRHQVAVGAAIGMLMALVVVQVAAQVVFQAERAEVEQQGKEAMVGTVARQVAMTAQVVAAVKARSVAMVLEGLQVLVAQENQAV